MVTTRIIAQRSATASRPKARCWSSRAGWRFTARKRPTKWRTPRTATRARAWCRCKPGEMVRAEAVDPKGLKTRPPARYSEATLLGAMEGAGKMVDDDELREAMQEKGLGTPATRAAIIEGLITEKYMLREGRELIPTAKAFQLMTLLRGLGVEELSKPELTGEWEYKLAQMEHGKLSRDDLHGRDRRHDRAHRQEGQGIRPRHHARRLRHAARRPARTAAAWSRKTTAATPAPAPTAPSDGCGFSFGKTPGRAHLRAGRSGAVPARQARSARWRASAPRPAGRSPPRSSLKFDDEDQKLEARIRLWRRQERGEETGELVDFQRQRVAGHLPQVRRPRVRARQQLRLRENRAHRRAAHAELRLQERQDHPAAAGGARADDTSCWPPARPTCWTSSSPCARAARSRPSWPGMPRPAR